MLLWLIFNQKITTVLPISLARRRDPRKGNSVMDVMWTRKYKWDTKCSLANVQEADI